MPWVLKTNLRGPQGPQGPQGLPGTNAVANDVAFAAAIKDPATQTRAALVSDEPRIPAYCLAPTNLSKWRAAKASALNGGTPAKLLIIGDSTSQGPVNVEKSWPTALLDALNRRGLVSRPGIITPATNIPDSRWAASGWVKSGTTGPGGCGVWFSPVSGVTALYFAPHIPFTDVTFHFVRQSGGGSCVVNNDGTVVTNIVTGTGTPNTYGSVSAARVGDANDIFGIEGPTVGGVLLLGAETKDTAKPHVISVNNWAQSGTTTDQWVNGTLSQAAVTYLAPHLTIIMLGINDSIAGATQANYQARMQTLITLAQATGDVIVLTNPRTDPAYAAGIGALQASYETGILAYCRANNVPVVDWYERIGPYAAGPWRLDQVHQSNDANQDIAEALAGILSS